MRRLVLLSLLAGLLTCSCDGRVDDGKIVPAREISAKGYPGHVEICWNSQNGASYDLWIERGRSLRKVATVSESPYLDFSIGSSDKAREISYRLLPSGVSPKRVSIPESRITLTVPPKSDEALLDMIQEYTTRYFTDFSEPYSGLARERSNDVNGDIVTIGGSGFAMMALIAARERGYVSGEYADSQFDKMLSFLEEVERFHGAWAHWYDADTRKPFSFSRYDDGGDIVETSFMAQGLVTLREYMKEINPSLASRADRLWKGIEWDWYTRDGSDSLYWHWSRNWGWKMNHKITGYDECFITYVMAASSPTHAIRPEVYHSCYKNSDYYYNGKQYYDIPLTIGMEYGGPLFFTHYSFLGLDPRGLSDGYTNYYERGRAHSLIHYNYAIDNPKGHKGLGGDLWGFTSSDDPLVGYCSHHPMTADENGTVSPTAPVSAIVYVEKESMDCIRHMYYDLGEDLFGRYGFYDAYNPSMAKGEQVVRSYLAIDQGPIAVMIENYRSQLLWTLFMGAPEISEGLSRLGLYYE